MARKNRIPALRLHKSTGQGRVTIQGKDHYCGKHGTIQCEVEYNRLLKEHGYLKESRLPDNTLMTVDVLALKFLEHAKSYYLRADGTETNEVHNFRQALKIAVRVHGRTPLNYFEEDCVRRACQR
jgi:hypothetical protein